MDNNSPEIKIMCIGDSITFGHRFPGSYRKFFYHNLISKGYKIKMVGAQGNKIEKILRAGELNSGHLRDRQVY